METYMLSDGHGLGWRDVNHSLATLKVDGVPQLDVNDQVRLSGGR